jgi:hypothetical protein
MIRLALRIEAPEDLIADLTRRSVASSGPCGSSLPPTRKGMFDAVAVARAWGGGAARKRTAPEVRIFPMATEDGFLARRCPPPPPGGSRCRARPAGPGGRRHLGWIPTPTSRTSRRFRDRPASRARRRDPLARPAPASAPDPTAAEVAPKEIVVGLGGSDGRRRPGWRALDSASRTVAVAGRAATRPRPSLDRPAPRIPFRPGSASWRSPTCRPRPGRCSACSGSEGRRPGGGRASGGGLERLAEAADLGTRRTGRAAGRRRAVGSPRGWPRSGARSPRAVAPDLAGLAEAMAGADRVVPGRDGLTREAFVERRPATFSRSRARPESGAQSSAGPRPARPRRESSSWPPTRTGNPGRASTRRASAGCSRSCSTGGPPRGAGVYWRADESSCRPALPPSSWPPDAAGAWTVRS